MTGRLVPSLLLMLALCGCTASGRALDALRKSPDPARRLAAVETLMELSLEGNERDRVVDGLARAVVDPDEKVRVKAVEALGRIGGDKARRILVSVLRGTEFKKAALDEFKLTDKLTRDVPEVLIAIGRDKTDLGDLKGAERAFGDARKVVEALDPQMARQHLTGIKYGFENLRLKYEDAGDQEAAKRVAAVVAEVDAKLAEAEAAGGSGFGYPGMPGMPF